MMNETLKSYKSDNRGSAIITGLVVSTVLMVLCLSLLLISYSLFISTAKSTSDLPNREMLYSAAEALEHELLDFSMEYDADLLLTDPTGHDFWQYIDNTIWKGFSDPIPGTENKYTQKVNAGFWMYYDPLDTSGYHNDIEKCSKYFNLTSIGSAKIVVQLYWQLPKGFDFDTSKRENKNGTLLNAIYRMYDNKGNLLVKTERKYIYSVNQSSGNGGLNYIVIDTPTTVHIDQGTHSYIYEFNNAIVSLYDYYQGTNAQFVFKNNNGINTDNWAFEIYFNEIDSVIFYNTENYDFIRQSDGWVHVSPKQNWNNTLNQSYYLSFGYIGKIESAPIVRQIVQNSGSQGTGSASEQQTSIDCTSFIQDEGSNNYSGKITITNTLNKAIENWTITFNHHGNNFNVQNGNKIHQGQTLTITNLDSNGHIEPGDSLDVIFTFKGSGNNHQMENISAYTTESSTIPSIQTIKWTRIGEEIVNPGGGN